MSLVNKSLFERLVLHASNLSHLNELIYYGYRTVRGNNLVDRQPDVDFGSYQRHFHDRQHIRLSYVIHFYFDQQKADTLFELLDLYATYNRSILDHLEFVIVDDGSSLAVEIPRYHLNIRYLRILDDIAWNQGGARNLAAVYAAGPNIIFSDLDLVFPEHTLKYLLGFTRPKRSFYKFWRFDQEQNLIHNPHSNVFFMSRSLFFENFGYDEEFSGGHGGEDYRFVKYMKYHGAVQRKLPKKYFIMNRKRINRETDYHSLPRDQSRNQPIDRRKRSENRFLGSYFGHSRIFLNFKWTEIARYTRRPANEPQVDRWWQRRWLIRQLRTIISDFVRA